MTAQNGDNRPEQQPQSQADSLEQFHSELSKLEGLLKELDGNTLSGVDRDKKEKEAKDSAEKLQGQVDKLRVSAGLDAKIVAERERAEHLLESRADTLSLKSAIGDKPSDGVKEDKEESTTEPISTETPSTVPEVELIESSTDEKKKGFLGRTGDWIGEQWKDVRDDRKWEQERGKNWLRIGGFALTGVGALALVGKGISVGIKKIKKRFGKDEEKEGSSDSKEKKSSDKSDNKEKKWWRKFFIRTGIAAGTVFGGVELYKNWNAISSWVKEKLGVALNFNEALATVENEVKGGKVDTKNDLCTFRAHFEGMSYDESTGEICSFGERTKINKSSKSIAGMDDVQFASWQELFHAVNIVNFAKRELKGKGGPFTISDKGGDIDFKIAGGGNEGFISANGSNFRTKTLGKTGAGVGGLLGAYFLGVKGGAVGAAGGGLAGYAAGSIIDNTSTMGRACGTIARGANLEKFVLYLNNLNIWEWKEQELEPDETSPIHPYLRPVVEEINGKRGEKEHAELHAEYDENNPSEVLISSYGQKVKLKLEGNIAKKGEEIDFNKITKISLLRYAEDKDEKCDLDIDFPHNEKGLIEAIRVANFTNKIRNQYHRKGSRQYPFGYCRYTTIKSGMGFDISAGSVPLFDGNILLSNRELAKYPTLRKDLNRSNGVISFGAALGTGSNQDKQHERAREDSSKGSQYIEYLNQMSGGMYRWKKA